MSTREDVYAIQAAKGQLIDLAKKKPSTMPCKLNPARQCSIVLFTTFGCRGCTYPGQHVKTTLRKSFLKKMKKRDPL